MKSTHIPKIKNKLFLAPQEHYRNASAVGSIDRWMNELRIYRLIDGWMDAQWEVRGD